MKLKLVNILLICFMASGVYATNSWVGPTGSWGTSAKWGSGHTPVDADTDIKISKANVTSCDLDVAAGPFETVNLSLGGNSSYSIAFNIKPSGSISIGKEFRVGDSGVGGQGSYGKAVQTGGSVVMNTTTNTGKLEIGYKTGTGWYIISGGSISSTGGMAVGSSVGKSGGASGGTGKFTVRGSSPSISVGILYVGTGDPTGVYIGTGTLAFEIVDGNVSAINAGSVYIDPITSASVANLLVSVTSGTPVGTILLVNNTGSNAVYGSFDSLNGGSGAEGTAIVLGGRPYALTYMYDSNSQTVGSSRSNIYNDIALVPTSITISTPAVDAGDLLIAAVATFGDTSASIAAPDGQDWTLIDSGTSSGAVTLAAWWKRAGSSEPNSHTFTWSGPAVQAYGWMMCFSGHDDAHPINTSQTANDYSITPTSPAVTTTVNNCIILRLGAFYDGDITVDNPGLTGHTAITMDKSSSVAGSGVVSGGAGYARQSGKGDSGTSNFSLLSQKTARMLTIAIAPASTGKNACCEDDIAP